MRHFIENLNLFIDKKLILSNYKLYEMNRFKKLTIKEKKIYVSKII
jgi:hypothetical protein